MLCISTLNFSSAFQTLPITTLCSEDWDCKPSTVRHSCAILQNYPAICCRIQRLSSRAVSLLTTDVRSLLHRSGMTTELTSQKLPPVLCLPHMTKRMAMNSCREVRFSRANSSADVSTVWGKCSLPVISKDLEVC